MIGPRWGCVVAFSSCLFISNLAWTYESPLPSAAGQSINVEPGVLGNIIKNQQVTPINTSPTLPSQPKATEQASSIPLEEAKKVVLTIDKIVFVGNHAFTDAELLELFKPYLHKQVTLAQFLQGLQAVTDLYQNKGYFLSKALLLPQAIEHGEIKINVVEGFISQVDVQGVDGKKKDMLLRFGEAIEQIRPIKLADLERYLLLINDIPGIQVKTAIEPDPKVPLGSKLTLVTQYSLLQTSISHDNYQTRYLGPQETTVYSNLNSLIVPGSSVLTHVLLSDTVRKLQFYEVQYKQVLGTEGLVVGVDAYNTETHPGFILTPLEILGSSSDITLSTTYPLIRSKLKNLYLTGQFELMNNYSDSFGQQLYHDKISDFALLTQFSNTLWKGDNSIILALYKGLNILGAPGPGFHSRGDASSDFFKTNLTMSREQYLGSMFSFYSLFTGQYANKPLFAAQQMAYGGPSIGRGYDLAQFIGDQGIAGKAELRLNTSTKWKFLNQVQYYAFYDAGKLYNYIDGFYALSGTSTGLGLRSTVLPHLNFEGFVAKPLTTPNATQVILKENGKAVQAYFQVTGYWSF